MYQDQEALHWENNISEWTGLMFRDAVIESENKNQIEGKGC